MTDIVERLRESSSQAGYPKHYIYEEAADEIERLRAEVAAREAAARREGIEAAKVCRFDPPEHMERLRSLNADFLHEEAAEEIERLRAGLRQIGSGNTCMALTTHPPICARAHAARALLKEGER